MKVLLSISLLLAYGALILRPSMPLLEYELRKGFIASTLCENEDRPEMKCDGKCYLNKRLVEAGSETPDPLEVSYVPPIPVHITSATKLVFQAPRGNDWIFTEAAYMDFSGKSPPSPPPKSRV